METNMEKANKTENKQKSEEIGVENANELDKPN